MKSPVQKIVFPIFCLALLFFHFSQNALPKETRIHSKNKAYSFVLPEGWTREKKPPKNEIIIFQSKKKMPVLNPYITFSYKKLKSVPSTPPPDDLWGQNIVKRIKQVDAKAKIVFAEPSIVSGKPAYVCSAAVSYKKLKKQRTFQKSFQIWDGKRKAMIQFTLVCLEADRKIYEPVLDKLMKSVKIKN